MINAEPFPGWRDLSSILQHLSFINAYQKEIERIAVVSNSGFMAMTPRMADHIVAADIRHFVYKDRDKAMSWLAIGE